MNMHLWTILLAAGQGTRLAAALGCAKQFVPLDGEPLYLRSARTLAAFPSMQGIVFVLPPDAFAQHCTDLHAVLDAAPLGLPLRCVPGGPRRQDSVAQGLSALPAQATHVLVHDGARPFVPAGLIGRLVDAWEPGLGGVIPGLPMADTIKVCHNGRVVHTVERDSVRRVQTPQLFPVPTLRRAHEHAAAQGIEATDDASLVECLGEPVAIVPGDSTNCKITYPEDLTVLLPPSAPRRMVIGYGEDVHAFGGSRPLVLGGMPIPGAPMVRAHSDGDVLLHALTDAILGCLGEGDIGEHFPDTDPQLDNIPSSVLLDQVLEKGKQRGFQLEHVDITIIAQVPRLSPHKEAIRANLTRLIQLPMPSVNLKATTEEGLGFTGRKEGIKAVAVALGSLPCSTSPRP